MRKGKMFPESDAMLRSGIDVIKIDLSEITGGFFEGGDFMPAGDFCLIGTGNRTDETGAMEAINSGVFDFPRIVIVSHMPF